MRAYREHLKVITKGLVEMATELGYLNTHFVRFVIQTIQSSVYLLDYLSEKNKTPFKFPLILICGKMVICSHSISRIMEISN